MYANVTYTRVEMDRWAEARAGIAGVKEMLRSHAGFVDATWFAPIDGRGMMVSRWESENDARDAAPPVGFAPAPGVTVEVVETREVIDSMLVDAG